MKNLKRRLTKEVNYISEQGYSKSLFIIFALYTKKTKLVVLDCMMYPRVGKETPNLEGLVSSPYVSKTLNLLRNGKYKIRDLQSDYMKAPTDLYLIPVYVMEVVEDKEENEKVNKDLRSKLVDEMISVYEDIYEGFQEVPEQQVYSLYNFQVVKFIKFKKEVKEEEDK